MLRKTVSGPYSNDWKTSPLDLDFSGLDPAVLSHFTFPTSALSGYIFGVF